MSDIATFDHGIRDDLVVGRTIDWPFQLYEADGVTPLGISSSDNVRAKLWYTDAASPAIEAESRTPGSYSKVTVDTVGTGGSVPAQVTIRWHQTDTTGLTADRIYKWELILIDQSDSSLAKPLAMGTVRCRGAATGSVAL